MAYLCYFNGEHKPENEIFLHVSDLAITRGFGAFDFMRAAEGVPLFLNEYMERFYYSAKALSLEIPIGKEELKREIRTLVEKNGGGNLGIRLILTGGYTEDHYTPTRPNLVILISALHFPSPETMRNGVKLMTYHHLRDIADIKSLNYLTPIFLRNKLAENKADDVLYHYHGTISESSRSNFFIVKGGHLITANEGILHGITRMKVLEVAKTLGIITQIRPLRVEELKDAEEVFITSTTKRILPVRQIDDQEYPVAGPLTKQLTEAYHHLEKTLIAKETAIS